MFNSLKEPIFQSCTILCSYTSNMSPVVPHPHPYLVFSLFILATVAALSGPLCVALLVFTWQLVTPGIFSPAYWPLGILFSVGMSVCLCICKIPVCILGMSWALLPVQ